MTDLSPNKMSKISIVEYIEDKYKVKLRYPFMRSKKELVDILTKFENNQVNITTENRLVHY